MDELLPFVTECLTTFEFAYGTAERVEIFAIFLVLDLHV